MISIPIDSGPGAEILDSIELHSVQDFGLRRDRSWVRITAMSLFLFFQSENILRFNLNLTTLYGRLHIIHNNNNIFNNLF